MNPATAQLSLALALTLACVFSAAAAPTVEVLARGLQQPWAVAFLADGRFLVTERPGRLRLVDASGRLGEPIKGLPEVDAVGQGGLLDLITDRNFAANRRLYF